MELVLAEEARQVPDPTQDVEGDSARSQVRAAVARLSPPEDEVVRRHSYGEQSFQEVVDALSLGKSTVADAFHRGVRRLRERLDPPPPEEEPEAPVPPPVPIQHSGAPPRG